jgi:cysteine desulfurase
VASNAEPIYLDYHASTPCDPRIVEAMLPYFLENCANASSQLHRLGVAAARAVEQARLSLAEMIGCRSAEIVFTSGATESNNLAILGAGAAAPTRRRKILVSTIEHKCVLNAASALRRHGFEIGTVPVLSDGIVDLAALIDLVDERTWLVSIQAASNEIGTVQPIEEIAQLVHRKGALFHCDAAQAAGRIVIDANTWDVDLMSLSAHKMYGPKGVGALFIRGGPRSTPVQPLLHGGGQEGGLRSGTQNVPGIVGFGRAAELAVAELDSDNQRIGLLRDRFEELIVANVEGARRNGSVNRRLAGNSSLTFDGADAEALIANLPDLCVSTGAACSSGALEPSHVLVAIGLSRSEAFSTLRVGIGKYTASSEVDTAASMIRTAVGVVRSMSVEGRVVSIDI